MRAAAAVESRAAAAHPLVRAAARGACPRTRTPPQRSPGAAASTRGRRRGTGRSRPPAPPRSQLSAGPCAATGLAWPVDLALVWITWDVAPVVFCTDLRARLRPLVGRKYAGNCARCCIAWSRPMTGVYWARRGQSRRRCGRQRPRRWPASGVVGAVGEPADHGQGLLLRAYKADDFKLLYF